MDQITEAKPGGKLSRSDFLKLAGWSLGSLAIEANNISGWLKTIDAFTHLRDNDRELRRAKFQEVVAASVNQPELLESWLKFYGMEIYASVNQLPLAEATFRQFLYREGEKLDIGPLIPVSVRRRPGWIDRLSSYADDQAILEAFTVNALNKAMLINPDSTNRNLNLKLEPEGKKLKRQLESGNSFQLGISGAGKGVNEDCLYSLNMFTQDFSGEVVESSQTLEGWNLRVTGGRYSLIDKYDWDGQLHFNGATFRVDDASRFLNQLTASLGIENPAVWLKEKLGAENYGKLSKHELIVVSDEDGHRLQESDVAQPFWIKSAWPVREADLFLPSKLLAGD